MSRTIRVFVEQDPLFADQGCEPKKLSVRIEPADSTPMAYFDLDKTLLALNFIYRPSLAAIFPVAEQEKLWQMFRDGFVLGTSYREFDRLHHIVHSNKVAWIDIDRYLRDRQKIIDAPGPARDKAAEYVRRYAAKTIEVADHVFASVPSAFDKARIAPVVFILRLLRKIGVATSCMTANNEVFARKVLRYSGLSKYFIDLVGDESMEGGGKEIAIQKLTDRLGARGVSPAKDRLMLIGDSLLGDIGVVRRLGAPFRAAGILVTENQRTLEEERSKLLRNAARYDVAHSIDVNVLVLDRVVYCNRGRSIQVKGLDEAFTPLLSND